MAGNRAHAQLWLLIENCTTALDFLLTSMINLQRNFIFYVGNHQNIWVLPGLYPPPCAVVGRHWGIPRCVLNTHHSPRWTQSPESLFGGPFSVVAMAVATFC